MGLPMAQALIIDALATDSHDMAQMAPSLLFAVASFGGLFACVVLCLICSECYSRYRNRHSYHGISQSSSGEHELPTTEPIQSRRIPSAARPIPQPPPSYDQIEREISRSRRIRHSTAERNPRYDQVISELGQRTKSRTHQSQSRRTHQSTTRAQLSTNPPFDQVVIESGRQAIQAEDSEPTTSSRNPFSAVRVTNTPPLLFDKVAAESDRHGLPKPMPNYQTNPEILKVVRRALQAEDSEQGESRITVRSGTQATPPPPFAEVMREWDRRGIVQVHRSQRDGTHQPTVRDMPTRSPSFDQAVIGTGPRATPHPHQWTRRISPAEGSISPVEEAGLVLGQCDHDLSPDYERFSVLTNNEPASFEDAYLRRMNALGYELRGITPPPQYRRMYPTPPPTYVDAMTTGYSVSPAIPIQYSPTWERFRPAFLRVLTPPSSTQSPHFSEEEQLQFYMSMSSKSDEAEGKPEIEAKGAVAAIHEVGMQSTKPKTKGALTKTKAEGVVSKTKEATSSTNTEGVTPKSNDETLKDETKWALPKTKGRPAKTDTERLITKTRSSSSSTDTERVTPKSNDETLKDETKWALTKTKRRPAKTDTERFITKTRSSTSSTDTEWGTPKSKDEMSRAEAKWSLPQTKGRPAKPEEWAQPKSRGLTTRTEMESTHPKTDFAVASPVTKLSRSRLRTKNYREWVIPETEGRTETEWTMPEGATARTETEWTMPEGATARTETGYVMPEIEDLEARTAAEGSLAVPKKLSGKLTELMEWIDRLKTVNTGVEFGGARPKARSKSAKRKKTPRKTEKSSDEDS